MRSSLLITAFTFRTGAAFVTRPRVVAAAFQRVRIARFAGNHGYHGPMQKRVEATLEAQFSPSFLEVINESHGRVEDESHFKVLLAIMLLQLVGGYFYNPNQWSYL